VPDSVSKRCSKCREVKPLDAFGRDRTTSDGLKCRCRDCTREDSQRRYAANAEVIRERRRGYYEANAETQRESRRRWYQEHKEEEAEANRERVRRWYQANLEYAREWHRQHHEAHRDEHLERMRKRQAEHKARVLAHYGEQCACCGTTENLSVDHIDGTGDVHREELFGNSRRGGGAFYDWLIKNGFPPGYQILCMPCNNSKGRGERCRLH
jgi:hypothetical protein